MRRTQRGSHGKTIFALLSSETTHTFTEVWDDLDSPARELQSKWRWARLN
jgi:hypothetical protein